MKLTAKQQAFITEYLIDMNGSAAMRRAGYTSKNPDVDASKLLVNPSIKAIIDKKLKERADANGVTAEMVLRELIALKDKCMGNKAVKLSQYDENGNMQIIEKYIFDSNGAKGSLDLLGKHLKLFTDKVEVDATVGVRIVDDIK